MAKDYITTQGLAARAREIEQMITTSPAMRKELARIIRQCISKARKNIVQDARGILDNDPRNAYKAVRSSVYKQILGGQVNILSPRRRGNATSYIRRRKLDDNPTQRGGNRRKRSERTMQVDSYEGKDRGFILRFVNAGTAKRETRYGNRGAISTRNWFGTSSAFQLDQAAKELADMVETMLSSEFKMM